MDHSLAIRKDPERVWDVPGSETGSRRDRGRVHHRMSFRKRRQLRYAEELLRILEAALGICAIMLMGTGSLWIGMIIMTAGLELSCRYIEKSVKISAPAANRCTGYFANTNKTKVHLYCTPVLAKCQRK